jgi:hypothetical protein
VPPAPVGAYTVTATSTTPTGAAFDLVLIVHVGCVLIGFASLLATGTQAWRARVGPEGKGAQSVARYFRPGINWPGRSLYLVLVFGAVLVFMSQGAYGFGDGFVELGLVLWIIGMSLAELVVWPGERILQGTISEKWRNTPDTKSLATRVAISAWAVCAVVAVACVVMVQK